MADERMVVTESEAYELLAHLVSSAEICAFEPAYYGPFRLLDGASRFIGYMLQDERGVATTWLEHSKGEIHEKKGWMMWDRPGFFEYLGQVTAPVAQELKRRERLGERTAELT